MSSNVPVRDRVLAFSGPGARMTSPGKERQCRTDRRGDARRTGNPTSLPNDMKSVSAEPTSSTALPPSAEPAVPKHRSRPDSLDQGVVDSGLALGPNGKDPTDTATAGNLSGESPASDPDAERHTTDAPALPVEAAVRRSPAKFLLFNIVLPLLILAAAIGLMFALGKSEPGSRPPADQSYAGRLRALPPVRVRPIQSLAGSGRRLRLRADGQVVPFREAVVASEVAGRVIEKSDACEAGQSVDAGQVLMRIDPTDYELEVERLSRLQQQEYEALREVDSEMKGTQRLIDVAETDVELQQRELTRQKNLPSGFASQKEVEQAQRALLSARQSLVQLQNTLETLRTRRGRLEASEKLAETQLRQANINLDRTTVRAPIGGVIVSENADVNAFVNRGTPLVTIETTDKVEIDSNLRQDQLYWVLDQDRRSDVRDGYTLPPTDVIVAYSLSGLENKVFRWKGRLVSYDGIGLDAQTRTVPVRIIVDRPSHHVDAGGDPIDQPDAPSLVRGMFVNLELLIEPESELIVIPAAALQPGNRVYQFKADPSVAGSMGSPTPEQRTVDDPISETPGADGNNPDDSTPSIAEALPPFDPQWWTAGTVISRDGVVAIDSLDIETADDQGRPQLEKHWVCRIEPGDATSSSSVADTDALALDDGAMVVVSPLGDFSTGSIDVRATTLPMEEIESKMSDADADRKPSGETLSDATAGSRAIPSSRHQRT